MSGLGGWTSITFPKLGLVLIIGSLLIGLFGWGLAEATLLDISKNQEAYGQEKLENTMRFSDLRFPFIQNSGQINSQVKFYATTSSGTVFVGQKELTYSLYANTLNDDHVQGIAIKERFVGAKSLRPIGFDKMDSVVNYFVGKKENWQLNIESFKSLSLGELWPSISAHLVVNGGNIEKIFLLQPGGSVDDIRMELDGALDMEISEKDELLVGTEIGTYLMTKPFAYQIIGGIKKPVEVSYKIEENTYGFTVANYDPQHIIVIDPVLESTYLGSLENESGAAIAVDSTGNVFVAGTTVSPNFPTTSGVIDESHNGGVRDVFVSKFNTDLSSLLVSTFIGGTDDEFPSITMKFDASENIFLAVNTRSADYPTTAGAYDTNFHGILDIAISKLNNDLTSLDASTFLGGTDADAATALSFDNSGNVFVGGSVISSDYPTTSGVFHESYNGGNSDGIISKLDSNLTTLLASTYIGGTGSEGPNVILFDADGNLILGGGTTSSDFPTTSGVFSENTNGAQDITIYKMSNDLTSLLTSTYVGGSLNDALFFMSFDPSGDIVFSGWSRSSDYPTTSGAFDETHNGAGDQDVIISKLSSDLKSLVASTFISGSGSNDRVEKGILDESGNVFVVGITTSPDFPVTSGAVDEIHGGGDFDGFVSNVSNDLTTLVASTFVGGTSARSHIRDITFDSCGNLFLTGYTETIDFPITTGAYDETHNGGLRDAIVTHITGDLSTIWPTPTLSSISIESDDETDPTIATIDDVVTLTFSSCEPIPTPAVTIDGKQADFVLTSPSLGEFLVASSGTDEILQYDGTTGEFIDVFADPSRGLNFPTFMVLGPDNNLYISNNYEDVPGNGEILVFDPTDGTPLGVFGQASFVASGLENPDGLLFGPDGNLYVSSIGSDEILRYDGTTGQTLGDGAVPGDGNAVFVSSGVDGPSVPTGIVFSPFTGNLLVSSAGTNEVLEYDGNNGNPMGVFGQADKANSGLFDNDGLVFGPDGHLYVSSFGPDPINSMGEVLRYDGIEGQTLGEDAILGDGNAVFVSAGSGGLDEPTALMFDPYGDLVVASQTDEVLVYDGFDGSFIEVFGEASFDGSGLKETTGLVFDVNTQGYSWEAGRIIEIGDTETLDVDFTIDFTNLDGISGMQVTTSTDQSKVELYDEISTDIDTQPNAISNDFDDKDGTTGTIDDRGDQFLTILDEPTPDGVRIIAETAGGAEPAFVSITDCSGSSTIEINSGDNSVVGTCGSIGWKVISGEFEATLKDSEGNTALALINENDELRFEPEIFAIESVSGTSEITFTGGDGTIATVSLPQGNQVSFDPVTSTVVASNENQGDISIVKNGIEETIVPGGLVGVDSTPPEIQASLELVFQDDEDENLFKVKFSVTDNNDPHPLVFADINGFEVQNGQLVDLEIDDDTEFEEKSKFSEKQCQKFQKKADKRTAKGKDIPKGLQKKLDKCAELPILEIEAPSFVLTVTATDTSNNSNSVIVVPQFDTSDDDDDDDDEEDEDDD